MKIQETNCNGNIEPNHKEKAISNDILCNNIKSLDKSYIRDLNQNTTNESILYDNSNNSKKKILDAAIISAIKSDVKKKPSQINCESTVCNKQYKINVSNLIPNIHDKHTKRIESLNQDCNKKNQEKFEYVNIVPADGETAFELSNADEMSENGVHLVPRGIVNPNYPGFQHLAHTLQDYSSNIEQFDHSENDMTDDDIDADIIEYQNELLEMQSTELVNGNDTNITRISETILSNDLYSHNTFDPDNQIPDLLKTITKNNNNDILSNCTTTDIENNFHTKDIIGDFNKEIQDEIRELLNYNINIEDDLQELRKDIKETFAKPIENTINNISDVVNDVIKKLVENDGSDKNEVTSIQDIIDEMKGIEEDTVMQEENENNIRTEKRITRPSFLLIENHMPSKIADAILSDGKEEINLQEYNTESLSHNVENTIKQLSTELRKIIPKLNEMRERDKLWTGNKKEIPVIIDGNSNNILPLSTNEPRNRRSSLMQTSGRRMLQDNYILSQNAEKTKGESRVRQTLEKSMLKAENNLSMRMQDYDKEVEYESFDVYNIETALPKLDLDAIENHIKAAKEAERRKRNDREEIRKRLAMDIEADENYYSLGHTDRPGKKPSLHSRLQNGKNLQICFMNEIASDNESQSSDIERNLSSNSSSRTSLLSRNLYNHPYQTRPLSVNITKNDKASNAQSGSKLRPTSLTLKSTKSRSSHSLNHIEIKESDFFALQATLQTEARIALAQAKEMARIQMERERRSRGTSPVTEMLRRSVEKARVPLDPPRRRLSRHLLTDVNITQLQVIVNELHSQIEALNDTLVKLLMARDELHMGQDSMLVDIEDLTRYLGVKEQTKKTKGTTSKGVRRLTSLMHK